MDEETCKKARIEEEEKIMKGSLKWNNSIYHLTLDPEDDIAILRNSSNARKAKDIES